MFFSILSRSTHKAGVSRSHFDLPISDDLTSIKVSALSEGDQREAAPAKALACKNFRRLKELDIVHNLN
jgi:hypothetical protein